MSEEKKNQWWDDNIYSNIHIQQIVSFNVSPPLALSLSLLRINVSAFVSSIICHYWLSSFATQFVARIAIHFAFGHLNY